MAKSFMSKFKKTKKDSDVQELKQVELFIQEGNLDEALEKIENLESKEDLDKTTSIKRQILKSLIYIQMGDCDRGLKLAEKSLEEVREIDNPLLMVDAIIARANAMLGSGELNGCLDVAEEIETPLKGVENIKKEDVEVKKACSYWLKGMVYRKRGELNLSLDCFQHSLALREKLENKSEIAGTLNDIGTVQAFKGNLDLALDHFRQSLEMYEKLGNERSVIRLFNNIGLVHVYRNEFDQALDYFKKGQDLIAKSGKKTLATAALLSNEGLIHLKKGDLDPALADTRNSLDIYEEFDKKIDNKYEEAICNNNLGNMYELKGELDRALEYYSKSQVTFEELGNKQKIAMCYNNIGNCYHDKGEIDKAVSYYEKSLELVETIGNNLDTAVILLNLVSTSLQQDSAENAQTYLQKLKEISENGENSSTNQLYLLGKALTLKTSKRVVKRAEAQQIFHKMAEGSFLHEYTVAAKKSLSELLLQELQTSGSEEILKEIKELLRQLLTIAESQNSYSLLAETYLLQSKIALLELDINSARQLLSQGRNIAETKGLQSLAVIISSEYDSLLNQASKLEEIAERNVSLAERLEMAELENMVTRIIRKKAEIQELKEEESVLFLLLSRSGMSLFSKQFVSESLLADQLIGGFLTAINAFSREAFSEEGSIEGIKHQDYTLLMTPVESLLGCYAFKGQSYYGHRKLQQFSEAVKSSDAIKDILVEADFIGKDVSEEPLIVDTVTGIFLSSQEVSTHAQSTSYGSYSQKVIITIKHGIYL
ncbi:MAG: tetratricopeptide repeat protein [Candidatus Odinarchaeota archaeon]